MLISALLVIFEAMGFLFPLFLLAGIALAIPVLIHLFNLRRYKRVPFPDTRFLRNIQLSTKRQAKIKNWRLLLLRLLFLAALVLAFAQPYWGGTAGKKAATVAAIYIDNSYSMTAGDGQENLLQQARKKARQLIAASDERARFLLLSNDRLSATRPMLRSEALKALDALKPTAKTVTLEQVMNSIRAAQADEREERWNVYLFSDLQQNTVLQSGAAVQLPSDASVYAYPLRAENSGNLYIDTAYFLSPTLDARQPNPLVVKLRQSGKADDRSGNLTVSVGGQVRAVSAVAMKGEGQRIDTLALQLNGSGWQDISLVLQDHPLSFDDTFRIAARTAPDLSVLVVGKGTINPYLQAAFRTYEGFTVRQENSYALQQEQWKQYSLIVLQELDEITPAIGKAVKEALARGQNILVFPGKINNVAAFNEVLKTWGDISLGPPDTSRQQVVSLQQAHPLLQDVLEQASENIQLPVAVQHYPVTASVSANQQALMSFRDGSPFLAQYALMQGKLYWCASALDDRSSNFALSYFFVPVLYKMAVQSGGGNMYAMSVGSQSPLWLPVAGADDRQVWHLTGSGFDAIPAQRPSGVGVELFLNNTVKEAGFYKLYSAASKDSVLVGLNADRSESVLTYADKDAVARLFTGGKINWLDDNSIKVSGWNTAGAPFPVWKICVIIALLCLAGETVLLLGRKKNRAAQPAAVAAS